MSSDLASVDEPTPYRAAAHAPGHDHPVCFYETEDGLAQVVARYVADGLTEGDAAIIVASHERGARFLEALVELEVDERPVIVADADATLARFYRDGAIDVDGFEAEVNHLFALAKQASLTGRVRVYGEMVDILWQRGERSLAIELEDRWNDLRVREPFTLLCAYRAEAFADEPRRLSEVCAVHTAVVGQSSRSTEAEGVRALAAEIAHRKETERALRRIVRDLQASQRRRDELERDRASAMTSAERLTQITSAIADAVAPEQVYAAIVDRVVAALDASGGALFLVDGRSARLVQSIGVGSATVRELALVPLDASVPALDAIRTGQAIWIESKDALAERYPHLVALAPLAPAYRHASLPIVVGGVALGSVALRFDEDGPFDETEQAFLQLVARYAGQALERLRLLDAERQSRADAELLYALAGAVIGAEHIEDVFAAALDGIERAVGTSRSAILAYGDSDTMKFRAWRGISDEYRAAVEGHSPWPRGVAAPAPVLIADVLVDPGLSSFRPLFESERIGALGFIPLVAAGRLIGKLMVYFDEPRALDPREIEMARAIADHVATGLSRFEAIAELKDAVRFHEMFAAVLGHDLRNPLAAIMTAAHVAMGRANNEKIVKPLARIVTSGDRMARMIEQLLDFTRVRMGGALPIATRSCDLGAVLRQVVDELDDANPEHTLALEEHGDTGGMWDHDRLLQVFSNLIGNAVQHGQAASGVRVLVDGSSADSVRVEVHNQGAIPVAILPNLFQPLSGRAARHYRSNGLGLGLHISDQIVRAHGGAIAVTSSEEGGTTFSVTLPRNRVTSA